VAEVVVVVLLAAAVLVVLLAGAGVLVARQPVSRLHFLAVATTVALPLLAAAAVVQQGLSLTSAAVAVIALVGALSGPALAIAIGRAMIRDAGVEAGGSGR
jgi:multisubunit Na+/H+ antiporter MnhG subunit